MDGSPVSGSQRRSRWQPLALAAAFATLAALLAWTASDNRALRGETEKAREEAQALRRALAAMPRQPDQAPVAALPQAPSSRAAPDPTDPLAAHTVRPAPAAAAGPFEEALKAQREAGARAGSSPFGRP